MLRHLFTYLLIGGLLVSLGCNSDEAMTPPALQLMEIPTGFPSIEEPDDNQFSDTRWNLGKMLFYDNILSADTSISCASCHKQTLAFSDDVAVSSGVRDRPGRRNTPSLANVAYHPYFTREGGVPTLEMQVLVPIQEHDEFDFNIVLITERLLRDSAYIKASLEAYDRMPDPFVITRSLACFERSLISGNSAYDHYIFHKIDDALSPSAKRGMELFNSEKLNCSACHSGFNFSNYAFENNGLYEIYEDPGRYRLTLDEHDRARFKVPGLRNIALTAPYMHDGSIATLSDVINHYESGGKNHAHKSESIKPFSLTPSERHDLIAFFESLTDHSFIHNPIFNK